MLRPLGSGLLCLEFAWQARRLELSKGSDVRPGVPWRSLASLGLRRCLLGICVAGAALGALQGVCGCVAIWPNRRFKIARQCGAKHDPKANCTTHTILRPLWKIEMLKKCTPLWREARVRTNRIRT